MSDLPDRAWLTPKLNQIADAAGLRAALVLGSELAGQQIYIPDTLTREHWLSKLVGLDEARAIAELFGGQMLPIPASLGGQRRKLAETLARMIDEGRSANQIARATGVCRRTVFNHRAKRSDKDDPQGSLF